jgi:hypothetical protein
MALACSFIYGSPRLVVENKTLASTVSSPLYSTPTPALAQVIIDRPSDFRALLALLSLPRYTGKRQQGKGSLRRALGFQIYH